jgi:hypothetical protein
MTPSIWYGGEMIFTVREVKLLSVAGETLLPTKILDVCLKPAKYEFSCLALI